MEDKTKPKMCVKDDSDLEQHAAFMKKLNELKEARYKVIRSIDPNAEFTLEERAEMIDEAQAAVGIEVNEKTDPESLRDTRPPEQKAKDEKELDKLIAFHARTQP